MTRRNPVEIDNKKWWGLPWWRSGWESACQCRGHGFEPWSGKITHAAEQLGPWATTTEPARLEPVLHNKRGGDSERATHRDEEWPPLAATRESPCTETKTQHSHKERKKEIMGDVENACQSLDWKVTVIEFEMFLEGIQWRLCRRVTGYDLWEL